MRRIVDDGRQVLVRLRVRRLACPALGCRRPTLRKPAPEGNDPAGIDHRSLPGDDRAGRDRVGPSAVRIVLAVEAEWPTVGVRLPDSGMSGPRSCRGSRRSSTCAPATWMRGCSRRRPGGRCGGAKRRPQAAQKSPVATRASAGRSRSSARWRRSTMISWRRSSTSFAVSRRSSRAPADQPEDLNRR